MTLISTLIAAFVSIFGANGYFIAGELDPNDLREKRNQAPFHEEQMMLTRGQVGHCPHG
jgi:hypothetical protein